MIDKKHLSDTVVCREKETVLEAARILRDTKSRHLVVLSTDNKPLGILSTVDINNRVVAQEKDPKKTKVEDVMTRPVHSIDCSETYHHAIKKMAEAGSYSIPVTCNGKLLGSLELRRALEVIKDGTQ